MGGDVTVDGIGEASLAEAWRALVGRAPLPLPGQGRTLARWQALAAVAAQDLSAVKLYEGHTDALAILAELGHDLTAEGAEKAEEADGFGGLAGWAVWAAEPPDARVQARWVDGTLRLTGRKAWCSGASRVAQAVVSCWDEAGQSQLAAVSLAARGVTVTGAGWHAVGMGATQSVDVVFDDAVAVAVGGPGDYTGRAGFWHGGAGIAACWYGGALPLAQALHRRLAQRPEPHAAAHLGRVDMALQGVRSLLHATAAWIDANPTADAQVPAMRVRAAAEEAARVVLDSVSRALGAAPFCRDAALARRFADLPVFLRQSHAERDLATLGQALAQRSREDVSWDL